MKKNLLLSIILMISLLIPNFAFSAQSAGIKDEKLHYVISYKWGLIHKDAGDATLSLRNKGGNYEVMLSAKTKPWADKVYQVRDTLLASIRKSDFKALSYSKIAHEDGKYGRDDISYKYSGNQVTGICKRYKKNKKGEVSTSSKTLTATGPVYDMLSVFYYLREIDYSSLSKNKVLKATVFSGSKSETITIHLVGKEKIKLKNKTEREAYHIKFNFTTGGKKKSSDDIDTWISTDSSHIPLYLTGSLPVGQVRVYYIP